jgi:hypothetical protein
MTGGAGYLAGSALGAGYGGKKAGDFARADDADKLCRAQGQVNDALAAYGRAVEKAQSEAGVAWQRQVHDADVRAAHLAAIRVAQSDQVLELTRRDLATLRAMDKAEAHQLLGAAAATVDAAATRERSPRARKRQTAWRHEAETIRAQIAGDAHPDVREVLILVTAAPGGADAAGSWLSGRIQRRTTVIAAADQLHTALRRHALADRQAIAQDLNRAKAELQDVVVTGLAAPIKHVEQRTARLKEELVVGGYLSKADAERLGRES